MCAIERWVTMLKHNYGTYYDSDANGLLSDKTRYNRKCYQNGFLIRDIGVICINGIAIERWVTMLKHDYGPYYDSDANGLLSDKTR